MQTELLKIMGMICGGCTNNVTHALKAVSRVNDVQVSLSAGEATVQYDEQLTSPDQLKTAVKNAGSGPDRSAVQRRSRQAETTPGGTCRGARVDGFSRWRKKRPSTTVNPRCR